MRMLITGARGFVAPYVMEALRSDCGGDIDVFATSREGGKHPAFGAIIALDVTDKATVMAAVARYRPTHLIHLAGIAASAQAAIDPEAAWRVHLHGTLNIADAMLAGAPDCRLINAGSGLIYGQSAYSGQRLDEDTVLAPMDAYGASKAAADLALGAFVRRGLKCLRMRPFNHIGPGQTESFVVPALAAQVARIERRLTPPILKVGNLDAERDFLDVRDVARAYAIAARKADSLDPGLILNIASGTPRRIGDILDWFLGQAQVRITVEQDPSRMRPSDLPRIVGDAQRARDLLGWSPEYSFERTLADVLADCRKGRRSGSRFVPIDMAPGD